MIYLSEFLWTHSWDVDTLVPNNFEFISWNSNISVLPGLNLLHLYTIVSIVGHLLRPLVLLNLLLEEISPSKHCVKTSVSAVICLKTDCCFLFLRLKTSLRVCLDLLTFKSTSIISKKWSESFVCPYFLTEVQLLKIYLLSTSIVILIKYCNILSQTIKSPICFLLIFRILTF